MGERLARLDLAGESQEHRTGGVFQPGIGDDHVEDRLRPGGDLLPYPEGIEQPATGRDDGGGARIAAGRVASAGSATTTGMSAPRPWRSASASASPVTRRRR